MKKAHVVTHTHWDREWRYPVWENRQYLVDMMDELLEILDTQPEYSCFLMDGQTVMVEDYLEYETALYIRGYAKNPADSLIEIREAFGGVKKLERSDAPANELAFITPVMKEKELREILSELRDFASASVIRIL